MKTLIASWVSPKLAFAILAVAAMPLPACKNNKPDIRSTTGYIVGPTADITTADKATSARLDPKVLRGAVMIATRLHGKKVKFCSGTLIEPGAGGTAQRVVTNHHCFAETGDDDKATPELLSEACTFTKIYFGFLPGETAKSFMTTCQAGSLRTDYEGDLAVFELAAKAPEPYLPLQLWDGEEAPEDRPAVIVHYPDVPENMEVPPEGGTKLPTAAITIDDCKVLGMFAISEWELDRTLPFSLRHTCDLIHGSSGSGLIDVESGKLLGVNWGGIKVSYGDEERVDNVATRASYVAAFLENRLTEQVAKADGERKRYNDLAASRRDDEDASAGKKMLAKAKDSCGVVGDAGAPSTRGAWLAFLLAPLLLTLRRRVATATAPLLMMLATIFFFNAPAARAEGGVTLLNPAVGWATAYLLNSAFVAEYGALWRAGQMSDDVQQAYLASSEQELPAVRAAFALGAARRKAQQLGELGDVGQPLDQHATARNGRFKTIVGIVRNAESDDARLGGAEASTLIETVAATFSGQQRQAWMALSSAYLLSSPTCPIDVADVQAQAEHQQKLSAGNRGLNARALIAPLAGWTLSKVQCLVFAMMAADREAQNERGFDPMPTLMALQQTGSPFYHDPALKAMTAVRQLQLGRYDEALRAVMELVDVEPAFRLPYDLIQRVYSLRHTGEGAVALQGM